MKKVVWENKSNGQLCITIPKGSGIKAGDIVGIDKRTIKKVVYSMVASDWFHYGHIKFLENANALGDYHICGVLTDKAILEHRKKPLTTFEERKGVVSNLRCVDMIMAQKSLDPTDNFKEIYEQFGDVELVLVHGDNWKEVPGEEFIKSKGGKTVKLPYYERLSDFNVIKKILSDYRDKFRSFDEFSEILKDAKHEIISTKAQTLKSLGSVLTQSKIEKSIVFTVSEWENGKEKIADSIKNKFKDELIVVRSSALIEDSSKDSMAGKYHSALNVDSSKKEQVEKAIEAVIESYGKAGESSKDDQILVQKQIKDVKMSGVILTREMVNGAPYYIINYDDSSGATDSVTKGIENKAVKISYFAEPSKLGKWEKLMGAIHELEKVLPGFPLDIEFGITNRDEIMLFQVRLITSRITSNDDREDFKVKKAINGIKDQYRQSAEKEEKIFSDMSYWNPAEIIGDSPNYLDYSLYDNLIMNEMWQKSLVPLGYSKTPNRLMISFGNKPYVDATRAFKFLTPQAISEATKKKLLEFYKGKLRANPEFHDKIEFEIAHSAYTLDFDKKMEELRKNGFNDKEIKEIKSGVFNVTNGIIKNYKKHSEKAEEDAMALNLRRIEILNGKISKKQKLSMLLRDCRNLGTAHFSKIARFAFIGKAMLESLVEKKVLNRESYTKFLLSLNSPASDFKRDFYSVGKDEGKKKEFLKEYGHLRPGTYDITSPRYGSYSDAFFEISFDKTNGKEDKKFEIPKDVYEKVDSVLLKEGFSFNAKHLFEFIKSSIEGREYIKFEFSKNLSDALEIVAEIGKELGFSREEMAKLTIEEMFSCFKIAGKEEMIKKMSSIIENKSEAQRGYKKVLLPAIIFSEDDFDIVGVNKAKPNFVTQKQASGKILVLDKSASADSTDVSNKIVAIENADPGFDWVLAKNILGLVTKYGGVASHMAIRCSEFGIPAAIGCGENIFSRIESSKMLSLDCKSGKLEAF